MRTVIIGSLFFVLFVSAGVNIIIFFKDLELRSFNNTWFSIPLFIVSCIGIYYLFRLDDYLAEQELARLNKKVIQETWLALTDPDGYEVRPTLSFYLLWFLIFAVTAIAPLFFGIKLLYEFHETVTVILLLLMILFGLVFGFGLLHSFILLVGKPVLRINRQGISHFMMEFIDWHDVTGLYLKTIETKGKNYFLEIFVKNPGFYQSKHKGLFNRFIQREHISLHLPVSEEKARVTEAVALAYLQKAILKKVNSRRH